MLEMDRTGLHYLQPSFLQGTGADFNSLKFKDKIQHLYQALISIHFFQINYLGLYRLEISNNPLADIPENAFDGLERSLWELSIHHNQLVEIPSRALRNLKKIKSLDLSGNQINCIELDSFSGLGGSLEHLSLASNYLITLPREAFSGLPKLETLDLSGNNLASIDPNVFQEGMTNLAKVTNHNQTELTTNSANDQRSDFIFHL